MAKLLNAKQEKFAQARAAGATQEEAYRGAGYVYSSASASAVNRRPDVKARVKELQMRSQHRRDLAEERRLIKLHGDEDPNAITLDWVQVELQENLRLAREIGNIPAANKCVELLGKTVGIFDSAPKRDTNPNDNTTIGAVNVQVLTQTLDDIDKHLGRELEDPTTVSVGIIEGPDVIDEHIEPGPTVDSDRVNAPADTGRVSIQIEGSSSE